MIMISLILDLMGEFSSLIPCNVSLLVPSYTQKALLYHLVILFSECHCLIVKHVCF